MESQESVALAWAARSDRAETSGWRLANIRKSFTPATVIDVGVAHGTPGLYGAFPKAHYVLLEPLEEYRQRIEEHVSKLDGEYHLVAVGDSEGTITLHVDEEAPPLTSALAPTHARTHATRALVEREVEMTTLDALWERQGWKPPFGLKIDTEGFEDRVVRGATRLLAETQFVIAEVSVAPRFSDCYSFAEFVALMDALGFRLCDLLDGIKSSDNGELVFVDAFFRKD